MSKLSANEIRVELIPACEKRREIQKVDRFLNDSTELFLGVAGELDSRSYNKKFADKIRRKLEIYPTFKASIIFTKANKKEQAIKATFEQNRAVCELLKDNEFGDRFSLYWSPIRQNHHFRLTDKNITLEEVHDHKKDRDVFVVENSTGITDEYKTKFDQIISEGNIYKLRWENFKDCIAS